MEKSGRTFQLIMMVAILAALLVAAVGCGSGSSSSSSSGQTSEEPAGEASTAFLHPKSPTNKYATFGGEAPADVREAASKVLKENLEAREAAEFGTQCSTLAKQAIQQIVKERGPAAAKSCPKDLKQLAEPLSESKPFRVNELSGPIAALRFKGSQAFALFHGKDTKDYAMPMFQEDEKWKVGAILTVTIEKDRSTKGS